MKDKSNRSAWTLARTFIAALFIISLAICAEAQAQEARPIVKASVSVASRSLPAPAKPLPQSVMTSLATLPEADMLLFINPHLIITDAAARVLPEKDLAGMREGLAEMKKDLGADLGSFDYIVLMVRFRKPNANLEFSLPEYAIVAGGDFSAEALLQFAKTTAKEKLREESYGSKTIGLITIDDLAKEAEKIPFLKPLSEVAMVALNGNTIAVGTPGYVRAAIDAGEGKGRISTELLNSVMRDPTALVSLAGSPWTSFAKTLALLGTENNPRTPKCDYRLGDFYSAITMDATSFKLRGAMYADNPDTAKIIKSLLATLLHEAAGYNKDKTADAILSSLVITPTDTEVLVQANVSQQVVADFIKEQTAPKKPVDTMVVEPPKPPVTTKPVHRRRHRTHKKVST